MTSTAQGASGENVAPVDAVDAVVPRTSTSGSGSGPAERYVIGELDLSVEEVGAELHGTMPAVPELAVPGTPWLRTSALACLADVVLGLLAVRGIEPRIPVTLSLDVHLFREIPVGATVRGVGRAVKSGQTVAVSAIDFLDEDGRLLGVGGSVFVPAPDPTLRMPGLRWALDSLRRRYGPLPEPFADRLRCEQTEPGTASMPLRPEVSNAAGTLNGGLVPVIIEEAVRSLTPGATLSSLGMQYLRPVRRGPAVARATSHGEVGTVQVHDSATDALAIVATTRIFPAPR
ncbi:Thioesterase [Frankia sp. AiPs1]|uniref:PaaI family thioesterase n=1 Tax=Frankia sp. AiPa1 TaxID=573492 RepID=UPI00202B0B9D|nr:hotdog domain-containing protein [Frankia sp. AiPa1]MCL9762679.1 PaaI family thioesterase [Frankia sp. AiPa1]